MESQLPVLALKALDALSLRAEVAAQNIANANTPGYRPLAVSFEQALASAASKGSDAVRAYMPMVGSAEALFGSTSLRLDLELQTASATAQRYAAVLNILDRELQLRATAVTGGK